MPCSTGIEFIETYSSPFITDRDVINIYMVAIDCSDVTPWDFVTCTEFPDNPSPGAGPVLYTKTRKYKKVIDSGFPSPKYYKKDIYGTVTEIDPDPTLFGISWPTGGGCFLGSVCKVIGAGVNDQGDDCLEVNLYKLYCNFNNYYGIDSGNIYGAPIYHYVGIQADATLKSIFAYPISGIVVNLHTGSALGGWMECNIAYVIPDNDYGLKIQYSTDQIVTAASGNIANHLERQSGSIYKETFYFQGIYWLTDTYEHWLSIYPREHEFVFSRDLAHPTRIYADPHVSKWNGYPYGAYFPFYGMYWCFPSMSWSWYAQFIYPLGSAPPLVTFYDAKGATISTLSPTLTTISAAKALYRIDMTPPASCCRFTITQTYLGTTYYTSADAQQIYPCRGVATLLGDYLPGLLNWCDL